MNFSFFLWKAQGTTRSYPSAVVLNPRASFCTTCYFPNLQKDVYTVPKSQISNCIPRMFADGCPFGQYMCRMIL